MHWIGSIGLIPLCNGKSAATRELMLLRMPACPVPGRTRPGNNAPGDTRRARHFARTAGHMHGRSMCDDLPGMPIKQTPSDAVHVRT